MENGINDKTSELYLNLGIAHLELGHLCIGETLSNDPHQALDNAKKLYSECKEYLSDEMERKVINDLNEIERELNVELIR